MKTAKSGTSNLVIGLGEVGKAVQEVLNCDGVDINDRKDTTYDVVHICYPYSDTFLATSRAYQKIYQPKLTIIHSTVPVGISRELGAVHSPIRGKHPNLAESVRKFTKFFGGERAGEGAKIFSELGVECVTTPLSETTEAMKLWDTTIYGINIVLEKTIHEYCQKHGLDFDVVYTQANKTYNEGYAKMGLPQFTKYILEHNDGEIGGHCVLPNAKILDYDLQEVRRALRSLDRN